MKPTSDPEPTPAGASTRDVPPPQFTSDQRQPILSAAAEFVASALLGRPAHLPDPALAGAAEVPLTGTYITLKRQGQLRACCGLMGEPRKLVESLYQAALLTATEDHRLPPISPTELPYLDLHVNLLHGLELVRARGRDRVAAVEVGRHGLRIQRGYAAGLLLPVVAVEHGWDAETFLRQACRKAGLLTTAWEDDDVSLFTFEGVEFGGPIDASALGSEGARAFSRFSPADLQLLADHARGYIVALARGWTPNSYVYGVSDGNVVGLALTVQSPSSAGPLHLVQFSMRPGLPLQATLFRLCEAAAHALGRSTVAPESIRVGVTVLSDPAMHGTVREPDLRGLDPARRALLLVEHDKRAWAFAPSRSPDDLFAGVRGQFDVLNPEGAALFSLAAESTEPEIDFRSAPRPAPSGSTRRPAVAGIFYPAEPSKLTPMVDALLGASERHAESWPAAMVPHAGLVYSGQLAAAVFNRLKIPELAIVIGPKHTRQGVDWAVAPHEAWSIPGATVPADPAVARALVEAIPGLQLDAAAHSREHAIEVELPFFAHLAPATRVVGIAVGGGNWEACQRFAHGLAEVIRHLPTHPLLVISSDMNHFATDRENRRLDAIALDAMERLDPAHLLATVTDHNISMCGVLPAVIVMETLRQLGGLTDCERVGYATSADVNGNTSRVVGYAGMLLN